MIFRETKLKGVLIIELERHEDERGFFARSWSRSEFEARGLDSRIAESNISFNKEKGTLRGMHYQAAPYGQAKLVRCTAGAVFDCVIDLRPDSGTFSQWLGVELSARNRLMLHVPDGFAHGFQTLEDATEVFYEMSQAYVPGSSRGVRWNDPVFGIGWPMEVTVINERDRLYPDYVLPTHEKQIVRGA
jgi:dTDP-4-dehydrorhamnose 3,5-epimerase